MKLGQFMTGAAVAFALSLTGQAASAGPLGGETPAVKAEVGNGVTSVWSKGGYHHHYRGRGGLWWGAPLVVGTIAYGGSCYSHCRAYRGPSYCHSYCGY